MELYKLAYLAKQKRWHSRSQRSPIHCLYERALPDQKANFTDTPLMVVDCEMSGLEASKHELLSIGWVQIIDGMIDYDSRQHLLVHARKNVGDSVTIHGLYDSQIAGAPDPSRALTAFAQIASQSVVVFHHASLDIEFLQKTALSCFSCRLTFPYLDTMMIERQRLARQGRSASLQLNLCRDRYGLPPAQAHNAMHDAVATGELLLAQVAHMGSPKKIRLQDLGLSMS